MKKYTIVLLQFIICHAFSQTIEKSKDYSPNLPKVNEFNNYSELGEVDLSSGKFVINVPFYTIKNDFINIPLGVNYKTSGVKVNEISSEIGLGWNFYGEGKITRELKGEPDEIINKITTVDFPGASNFYDGQLYSGRRYPLQPAFITKQQNTITSKPIRGSITSQFTDNMMYDYPNLKYYAGANVPWKTTNKEVEAILLSRHKGLSDFKRDVFHVSIGDLNFSFAFRIKPEYLNHANSNSIIDSPTFNNMIEAIPLNDKAIKIEYFISNINYYKTWHNAEHINLVNRVRDDKMKAITKFIITDKQGVKYTFDKFEFIENEQIASVVSNNPNVKPSNKYAQLSLENIYIGSWKVSKIEMPNGHTIKYNYTKSVSETKHEFPREHTGEYKNNVKNLTPLGFDNGGLRYIYNGKEGWRLYSIVYYNDIHNHPLNKIKFEYSTRRDYSFGGDNLKRISLKAYNFDSPYEVRNFEFLKYVSEVDDGSTGKRMFLKEIIDSQKKYSYTFEYNQIDALPRTYEYWCSDIFGYYKGGRFFTGNLNNVYFPKVYVQTNRSMEGNRISYFKPKNTAYVELSGIDKSPNSSFTTIGTLKKINFPTGGFLEVNYEANTFFDVSLEQENQIGPGVRVNNLSYYATENNLSLKKQYEYTNFEDNSKTSGHLLYKPAYAYIVNAGVDNNLSNNHINNKEQLVTYKELERKGISHREILKKLTRLSTHPLSANSDIYAREIVYTNVKEKIVSNKDESISNGYTKFTFHYDEHSKIQVNSSSGPTQEQTYTQSAEQNTGFGINFYPWAFAGFPFNSGSSNDGTMVMYGEVEKKGFNIYPFPSDNYYGRDAYLNGKLIKTEVYNSDNVKISLESYNYEKILSNSPVDAIYNFNIAYYPTHIYAKGDIHKNYIPYTGYTNFDGIYFFTKEKIFFNAPTILKSKTKTFWFKDQNNNQKSFSETANYFYDNSSHFLKTREETTNSKGETIMSKFLYPGDKGNLGNLTNDSSIGIDKLIVQNRISVPIQTETFKDGLLLHKIRQDYKNWNNNIVRVEKISTSKGNQPLEERVIYHNYDNFGNPLEVSQKDGTHTVYIWGYHQTQPIAKIENATYAQIQHQVANLQTLSNADDDRTVDTRNTSGVVTNYIGNEGSLRKALNDLRNSLPNAQVTTYTYDPLVGVTSITDHRGQTVHYQYDDLNRLQYIKDSDGNVLSENQYNYKSKP